MGEESATKISELVATNPAGTDERSTLDNHIRMVKTCLLGLLTQAGKNDIGLGPVALTGLAGQSLKVNVAETGFDLAAFEPANANIQAHIASSSNPHSVTAAQVLPTQTGNGGRMLTTDGTTVSWGLVASHPESIARAIVSGTWTKVAGVNWLFVELVGGGGGGAYPAAGSPNCDGGGGGAGGYSAKLIDVSALATGATITYTVGVGGAGSTSETVDGSTGGTTSFTGHHSATGGLGGVAHQNAAMSFGGQGGMGSGGNVNLRGEQGKPGGGQDNQGAISQMIGGQGGSTRFGVGGRSGKTVAARTPEAGSGAGGGGGASNNYCQGLGATAGAGASGCIVISEYK